MTAPALINRLFAWKVRGIRWVEIIGVMLVGAMVFSVYVAKAGAAREGSRISELEREIASNSQRVRLLRAEVARLENPARLEALSRGAGLEPIDVHRLATVNALPELAPLPEPPAPEAVAAEAPAVAEATTPDAAPVATEAEPAASLPAEEAAR